MNAAEKSGSCLPLVSVPPALAAKFRGSSLPALDGMRAVAVALVVGLHLGYSRIPGELGVLSFFVLSGFLITWLLLKELESTGQVSIRDFYRRRMLRIFPAFYCFWAVQLLYAKLSGTPLRPGAAFSALFYLSNYYYTLPVPVSGGLSHTWSLGVEEQFYLLWPWVFVWQSKDLNRLAKFVFAAMIAIQLWRPILLYLLHVRERYVMMAFDTQADALLAGCLLALLVKVEPHSFVWRRVCHSVYGPCVPLMILAGASYLCWRDRPLGLSIGYTAAAYSVPILMVQLIHWSNSAPWRWLNFPAIRYLGRVSYPVYLYHLLTMKLGAYLFAGAWLPVRIAAGLAMTIAAASLSYFLIEKPFLRLKHRIPAVSFARAA